MYNLICCIIDFLGLLIYIVGKVLHFRTNKFRSTFKQIKLRHYSPVVNYFYEQNYQISQLIT